MITGIYLSVNIRKSDSHSHIFQRILMKLAHNVSWVVGHLGCSENFDLRSHVGPRYGPFYEILHNASLADIL